MVEFREKALDVVSKSYFGLSNIFDKLGRFCDKRSEECFNFGRKIEEEVNEIRDARFRKANRELQEITLHLIDGVYRQMGRP